MTKGIFVTGTDTGVGKTVASAVIVAALMRQRIRVGAMKPIETGCEKRDGILVPADGSFLRSVSNMDDSLDLITPVRYELPLAPYVAESEENREVDLGRVFEAYKVLSSRYDFMVVEGVGGAMVPLTKKDGSPGRAYLVADLMADLGLQAVVVARPALGTINHTLLTLSYLFDKGIGVAGIIISFSKPPDGTIAESTNPRALAELCRVPIVGTIPYMRDISAGAIQNAAIDIDTQRLMAADR
ncbi:MAG TPA: dethiobiotin synthase [Dissulfurispiraceae bacterium]|nr:dethiobiotin synthase [Dissulfurispiraceae bacterium]